MWTTAIARTAVVFAAIAFQGAALAQVGSFPDRPIKFIVPYGPGGTVDPTARTLATRAAEILGQAVVVENKPGAAGSIGTDFVVRAPADGYSVLIHTNVVASEPWLKPALSYNFLKDMTPLLTIDETPFVVLVHPSLPVNSIKELVEYAKEHPASSTTEPRASRRPDTCAVSSSSSKPVPSWSSSPTSMAEPRCAACWATRSRSRSTRCPARSA